MTETEHGVTEVPSAKGTDGGQLMSIGAVAAHNIAQALSLGADKVGVVETAIKDEIDAMAAHFSLAFRDVQDQHEIAETAMKKDYDAFVASAKAREAVFIKAFEDKVASVKSTFNYVEANKVKLAGAALALLALGAVIGHVL